MTPPAGLSALRPKGTHALPLLVLLVVFTFRQDGWAAPMTPGFYLASAPDAGPVLDEPDAGVPADAAAGEDLFDPRLVDLLLAPLPPAAPTPQLSPLLDERPRGPVAVEPLAAEERPAAVIRTILGLLTLLALAYLSGHTRVQRFEERLGLSQMITAGFPFVLLGLVARLPAVGVLSDQVLAELKPVLRLGLGWIGFMVGFRLDNRLLDRLPSRAVTVAFLFTMIPFAAVLGATGLVLTAIERLPENLGDPVFLRDALLLGTAGAMTAHSASRLLPSRNDAAEDVPLFSRILRLEEISGIAGLAVIAAYFRPHAPEASWRLPGAGWLLLTLGLGMAAGVLMYLLLRVVSGSGELITVVVGIILFAAGFAGAIRLSPVVVCFVMGVIIANVPAPSKKDLGAILVRLERPLYFLFLLIVGALWDIGDWRGWGLMLVFVASRLGGKFLAVRLAGQSQGTLSREEGRVLAIAPVGPLALAIAINAQLLYPGGSVSMIVTAILGGAIVTEVLVQLSRGWWGGESSVDRPG